MVVLPWGCFVPSLPPVKCLSGAGGVGERVVAYHQSVGWFLLRCWPAADRAEPVADRVELLADRVVGYLVPVHCLRVTGISHMSWPLAYWAIRNSCIS